MFFSLLAGLLMAFAFQLLLTNLGVALGLSALGWVISPTTDKTREVRLRKSDPFLSRSSNKNGHLVDQNLTDKNSVDTSSATSDTQSAHDSEDSGNGSVLPVSHLLGIGVTLTLAPVLFATAFLTTTFSGIAEFSTGLIFGLILWAAYLLILIWISSITVSGILDFVLGTATAGIRRLFSTVEQIFSLNESSSNRDEDELQQTIKSLSTTIQQTLSEQQQLPTLLAQQREALLDEICDRTNLTPPQAESVLENIQPQTAIETAGEAATETATETTEEPAAAFAENRQPPALDKMLPNWRDLLRAAVSRIDTSELDIETAWNTFQNFVDDSEAEPFSIVELDAENYLKESPVYALQAETVSEEFTERIYDPEADPTLVEAQIQALKESDFAHWLHQRGDLTADSVDELAEKLTAARSKVLEELAEKTTQPLATNSNTQREESTEAIENAENTEAIEKERELAKAAIAQLDSKLISYFRYTSLSKLSKQSVEEKLQSQLEELEIELETLRFDNLDLDFEAIAATIANRKGITKAKKKALLTALKDTWQRILPSPSSVSISHKISDYLQSIDWSEANLEGFKDEILQQVKTALVSSENLSQSISPDRLVATLNIPSAVKTDLLFLIKAESQPLLKRPRRWVERAAHTSKNWGSMLTHQIKTYLQQQDLAAKPDQIVEEASSLLKTAANSIPTEELPELGVDFWRQILAHRQDLTPDALDKLASRLSDTWDSATQTFPYLKAKLKEQSTEQWQDIQKTILTLSHFVGADMLSPMREAVPGLDNLLEPTRQKFVEAIETAQVGLQQRKAWAAQELQEKAEQVRHQVAIALWWLFISLFASGASSAAGGWLAVWISVRSIG